MQRASLDEPNRDNGFTREGDRHEKNDDWNPVAVMDSPGHHHHRMVMVS